MAKLWRDEVRQLVASMPGDTFTLGEIYEASHGLRAIHPDNHSINDTIRRVLQELRDLGELQFLARGSYRRTAHTTASQIPLDDHMLAAAHTVTGAVDSVPLEARVSSTLVSREQSVSLAIAHEKQLVDQLRLALVAAQHDVMRWRIQTTSGSYLYTDIFDATEGVLYEAKANSDRDSIRMAIGQLFDYARFIPRARKSILVPCAPEPDMIVLLNDLQIGVVYPGAVGTVLDGR